MYTIDTRDQMLMHLKDCSKRWLGQRSQDASITACAQFIEQCLQLGIDGPLLIEQRHIDCYKLGLDNRGLSASTINTRLVAVKAYIDHLTTYATMSFFEAAAANLASLRFTYMTRKKLAKWHLTDEQMLRVEAILEAAANVKQDEVELMLDYIAWTSETGLRVEETLRLLRSDFDIKAASAGMPALNVPGTKNEQSAVRIPISDKAWSIILRRNAKALPDPVRLFDISYARLKLLWNVVREGLGVRDNPTSTLKALRRNFALNALRKGLPPRIIQELMRHSNLETTMGYLRLLGMSDNPETRALLNRELDTKGLVI